MGEAPPFPQAIVVALEPAELDAVAARYGLRAALRGGLTSRHHAPLAAFILTLLFAAILAMTDFISRRAGELTFLIAACAFMIQRLWTHRRIWRARKAARSEVDRLLSGPATTTIDADGVTQGNAQGARRLPFIDCIEAEEAGGLLYLWGRDSAPVVLPSRLVPEDRGAELMTFFKGRIRR